MNQLAHMREIQKEFNARLLTPFTKGRIVDTYTQAGRRLLFLDYDGTLVPFMRRPELAAPDQSVLDLLRALAADPSNTLVLISGRNRATLQQWFGALPLGIVAEYGMWLRERAGEWQILGQYSMDWKDSLLPILLQYADRLPGSFVEDKEYSLVWHYRAADPEHSRPVAAELLDHLAQFTANIDVQVMQGNKVLEIRNAGVNKGRAAMHWLSRGEHDFILAVGDDWTDEDLFQSLPEGAYSFRVGITNTRARFNLRHPGEVHELLRSLIQAIAAR